MLVIVVIPVQSTDVGITERNKVPTRSDQSIPLTNMLLETDKLARFGALPSHSIGPLSVVVMNGGFGGFPSANF